MDPDAIASLKSHDVNMIILKSNDSLSTMNPMIWVQMHAPQAFTIDECKNGVLSLLVFQLMFSFLIN